MEDKINNLYDKCLADLQSRDINIDQPQQETLKSLCLSYNKNYAKRTFKSINFKQLFLAKRKESYIESVYIYGKVGRGKSMIMDVFYHNCPEQMKKRIHFHEFMQNVHQQLLKVRNDFKDKDPLAAIAKSIAKDLSLICLDELQITDIGDAMIVAKLFKLLIANKVMVVFTSNRAPEELYSGGLQRESFEEFIKLINSTMNIIELNSPDDYRLKKIFAQTIRYFTPLGPEADLFVKNSLERLCASKLPQPINLTIQGRNFPIKQTYGNVAVFSFNELCKTALGAGDYIEICKYFDIIFLTDIPILQPEDRNEAKRFITLIDTIYEHKIILICTAAAIAEQIYVKGDGVFEFERTISRLIEMQSEDYVQKKSLK